MHDVVPPFDGRIQHLLEFVLIPLQFFGDAEPRVIERKENAGNVNSSYPAQIAEIKTADHFVSNEQRIGRNEYSHCFVQTELQILELVFECLIIPRYKITSAQSDHFRQVGSEQGR